MNDEDEIAVFWVVKELGTPTLQEVFERYRDHFDEEPSELKLVLTRWVLRFVLDMKGDRYKARQPGRMFKRPRSPGLSIADYEKIQSLFDERQAWLRERLTTPPAWYHKRGKRLPKKLSEKT